MSAGVEELLMRVAEVAGRKLTWWQYDQTSWSAREWMPFALQRLSVQLWMALADEAQRAIGAPSRGREVNIPNNGVKTPGGGRRAGTRGASSSAQLARRRPLHGTHSAHILSTSPHT